MLGRYHVGLSLGTILPFLIPLFFLSNSNAIQYGIVFLIAIIIGSLTPDADCGGKSKLYYDFEIVYILMQPIQKITELIFKSSHLKDKVNLEYEVKKEHRGIMHAPIGILISTILLLLILSTFLVIFKLFNPIFLLILFFGLLIGQFLHLLEDSCTISGINWKFPFGTKIMNGEIYTWDKKDLRCKNFQIILIITIILLILGYSFNKISTNFWVIYPLIFIIIVFLWFIFMGVVKVKVFNSLINKEEKRIVNQVDNVVRLN
ncbi:MAG: metal-dependent hydrolase [Nanoarchaeota archaeon]|nr:metal-dependent hydrolase [Nanoarchaeota archaeon]